MRTEICERLGIEYPIFAFTHCRDVVAAVSQAGGLGVLGAVGFTPEQLRVELEWLDEHVGDKPYAVDLVIPQKYEGMGELDPEKLEADLQSAVPEEHPRVRREAPARPRDPRMARRKYHRIDRLDRSHRDPPTGGIVAARESRPHRQRVGNPAQRHHRSDPPIAVAWLRLCAVASNRHCDTRKPESTSSSHRARKLAATPERSEASFCGPRSSSGGPRRRSLRRAESGPVLRWLQRWHWAPLVPGRARCGVAVTEADARACRETGPYFQASCEDTVRSRSWTGKPARLLKNEWTEAWEREDTPDPLGMPLQGLVTLDAIRRTKRYANVGDTQAIAFNPRRTGGGRN